MADEKTNDILSMGVKAAGEYVIPGGANLVKGDLKEGVRHALLGVAARAVFGMPGLIAVSLNSLTQAVSGRDIADHLGLWKKEPATTAVTTTTVATTEDTPPARPRTAR